MPDLRKTIQSELDRRGWSAYRLAKVVKGKVSVDVVYKFLAGSRKITHEYLGHILDALGLEVRRKR